MPRHLPTSVAGALLLVLTVLWPTAPLPPADGRAPATTSAAGVTAGRPHVVLITADDQTVADMRWLPRTRRVLGDHGVTFRNMVAPHPNCCPSRAQLLTGQYAHNNGVRTNGPPHGGHQALTADTALPVWLQEAGYLTAFTGKYLHGYDESDPVEPGWTVFRPVVSKSLSDYYSIVEYDHGVVRPARPEVYHTRHVAGRSVEMIGDLAATGRPFFLWSSYLAPHGSCATTEEKDCSGPPEAEPRYAGIRGGVRLPSLDSPSFNEKDLSDKPRRLRGRPLVSPAEQQQLFTARLRALASLDDAVVRTVRALARAGVLDDTVVMFTSDNGYLFGEHRLEGKNVAYEEAIRVPLLVRGPGVPAGERRDQTVAMIDLAPTIARLAGATPRVRPDGIDLWRYATRDGAQGDRALLVQAGSRAPDPARAWQFRAVRTSRYTYVDWPRSLPDELYDRELDPFQVRSVERDRSYARVRRSLRRLLEGLSGCAGPDCRVGARP